MRAFSIGRAGWRRETFLGQFNSFIEQVYPCSGPVSRGLVLSLLYKEEYRKAQALLQKAQQLPAGDPNDPTSRRLRYVRYADDVLCGFLGPREEAEQIKQELGTFLQNTLKLEVSSEKTLITHAQTQAARFLGYDLQVRYCNDKLAGDGYRR